jgi:hypothetical protein
MNDKLLKEALNQLYDELENSGNKKTDRIILAKAVQLGIEYEKNVLYSKFMDIFK